MEKVKYEFMNKHTLVKKHKFNSCRGRDQINLFNTIKSDLNLKGYSLDFIEYLCLLRDVARD